jgi:hypothetical protein
MYRRLLSALILAFVGISSSANAIELFTNFNYGMELGTRPYGIPEMPPVRYHWWQRNYCPPPEMQAPIQRTAPSNIRLPASKPEIVQPQSSSDGGATGSEDERLDRRTNFLPAGAAD